MALLAITSLAFMFHEVPEPVWNTSMGKWASHFPSATSAAARAMASAIRGSSSPSSPLTMAATCLTRPSACTSGVGMRRSETEKFSTARCVCAPQ